MFAYNSSMQLTAPQPRRHKVLMSFRYWNAWDVIFFDTDRMRTALPRRARFNNEALIEFAQRAGGIKMSEDRQILDMMIQRKIGEITLNLTDEQYTKHGRRSIRGAKDIWISSGTKARISPRNGARQQRSRILPASPARTPYPA